MMGAKFSSRQGTFWEFRFCGCIRGSWQGRVVSLRAAALFATSMSFGSVTANPRPASLVLRRSVHSVLSRRVVRRGGLQWFLELSHW